MMFVEYQIRMAHEHKEGVSTGITKSAVAARLAAKFKPAELVVIDTSAGCGSKFEVYISSSFFDGIALLERYLSSLMVCWLTESIAPH
jgi:stress-induced morphogen